jgi:hypothetical protein
MRAPKIHPIAYISFIVLCFSLLANDHSGASVHLTTLYGDYTINEPILVKLIQCPSVQRLKSIHQYGAVHYVYNYAPYSRYEHSIGVFILLRRYDAPLDEQIAGLLHDVSHTVFSHVGDFLMKRHTYINNSYQDDIHTWFLEQTEIPEILKKYGFEIHDILHKSDRFARLERDIPNICADRLEYNLYGGYLEKKFTATDICFMLDHLHFNNNEWFFDDISVAQKFAYNSLYLTEKLFASGSNWLLNMWTAKALRRALKLGILSLDDIHFGRDDEVWNKLIASSDSKIKTLLHHIVYDYQAYTEITDGSAYDYCIHPKFRGIDPWVKTAAGIERLTALDKDFACAYQRLQERLHKGIRLKLSI